MNLSLLHKCCPVPLTKWHDHFMSTIHFGIYIVFIIYKSVSFTEGLTLRCNLASIISAVLQISM